MCTMLYFGISVTLPIDAVAKRKAHSQKNEVSEVGFEVVEHQ